MNDEHHCSGCAPDADDVKILVGQATNHVNLAIFWINKKNYIAAEVLLAAVKQLLTLSGVNEDDAWVNYYHARASINHDRKQFQAGLSNARKSLIITRRLYPAEHYSIAIAEANVGEYLGELGYKDAARTIIAASIEKLKAADVGTEQHVVAWKEATLVTLTENLDRFSK